MQRVQRAGLRDQRGDRQGHRGAPGQPAGASITRGQEGLFRYSVATRHEAKRGGGCHMSTRPQATCPHARRSAWATPAGAVSDGAHRRAGAAGQPWFRLLKEPPVLVPGGNGSFCTRANGSFAHNGSRGDGSFGFMMAARRKPLSSGVPIATRQRGAGLRGLPARRSAPG